MTKLTRRATNVLAHSGIQVGREWFRPEPHQVAAIWSEEWLLREPNCGKVTVENIRLWLEASGLVLAKTEAELESRLASIRRIPVVPITATWGYGVTII